MNRIKRIERTDSLSVSLKVQTYREGDSIVMYSSALELSGYGDTNNEAAESFQFILQDFLNYNLSKNSLSSSLIALGWDFEKDEHPGELDFGIYAKDDEFLPTGKDPEVAEFTAEFPC